MTFLAAMLLAWPSSLDSSRAGSVCVAPLPEATTSGPYHTFGLDPFDDLTSHSDLYDTSHPVPPAPAEQRPGTGSFRVRIDDRPPVPVAAKGATSIDSLDLARSHLVAILGCKGEAGASGFRFRFRQYHAAKLCLVYKWGYDTWALVPWKKKNGYGCDCP